MATTALHPRNTLYPQGITTEYFETGSTAFAPRGRYVEGIIVPAGIKRALSRNQFNYMDILNYDKIRKILSVEDLAIWLATNRLNVFKAFDNHGGFAYGDLFATSADTQKDLSEEFNKIIYPLSIADTTKEKAQADLHTPPGVDLDRTTPIDPDLLEAGKADPQLGLYEYKIINESLFILFVETGILDAIEDRDYLKVMVSNYLKTLYSLLPLGNVSDRYRAFETFINLL